MVEMLVVLVVGLLVIVASGVLADRLGVAPPLLLVVVGIVASLLPWMPVVEIDPEWILQGLLPPLLYASAVSMPTMSFKREFGAISGLSVLLVVISSLVLGLFFAWLIPDLGFVWGVALGAILSPTDAVATSIVKRTGISRRVLVILDGESLLNDATALVLLRTAIIAAAATFSFWSALGTFAYAVIIAVAVGCLVGWANLFVRRRVHSPVANTIISFTVPFLASIPAELLDASGLVAAVVAGLITGYRSPRVLPPEHRLSDTQNWATIEHALEGAVFLTMGLQISEVLTEVHEEHTGIPIAFLLALGALAVTILVRTLYVAPLLWGLSRKTRRSQAARPHVTALQNAFADSDAALPRRGPRKHRPLTEHDRDRLSSRIRRALADIDYLVRNPLGPREGSIVVWAGMRGAVTVAAAQTLPENTPHRALIVFIAFAVATLSLLIQGGTIKPLVARLAPPPTAPDTAGREAVLDLLKAAEREVPITSGTTEKQHRLTVLDAQRTALLDARDAGTHDADELTAALRNIDAEQIALDLRGGPDT